MFRRNFLFKCANLILFSFKIDYVLHVFKMITYTIYQVLNNFYYFFTDIFYVSYKYLNVEF